MKNILPLFGTSITHNEMQIFLMQIFLCLLWVNYWRIFDFFAAMVAATAVMVVVTRRAIMSHVWIHFAISSWALPQLWKPLELWRDGVGIQKNTEVLLVVARWMPVRPLLENQVSTYIRAQSFTSLMADLLQELCFFIIQGLCRVDAITLHK